MHLTAASRKIMVSADGTGVVSQAGGLLLTPALRITGLDRGREEARERWRAPRAGHSPGKIVSDLAVTLGCGEECPYVPGVRYVDWPVDDPKGQDDETVRRIVADLDARVRDLLSELVPDLELPPSVVRSA